ncbi:MAG: triosephosphate isomerase [Acidimicrobiia bacterium]|nr:MAG: triosephosphate isomerase [Acidimicrobiia bacterium]
MTERRDLICGNWKMHATHLEAIQKVQKLSYRLEPSDYERVEVVVAPPFTALRSVQTVIEADHLPILLGAQHTHWENEGAYTGEVSPVMLAKLSVRHVIVGHSERRRYFGETDDLVNRRAKAVIANGMTPIVCVGETLEEREAGATEEVVVGQVRRGLAGIPPADLGRSAIAYEPVWAIGTGRNADPDDAGAVCELIRDTVAGMAGTEAAAGIRILYGGSVNPGKHQGVHGQAPHRRCPGGRSLPRPRHLRFHRPLLDVIERRGKSCNCHRRLVVSNTCSTGCLGTGWRV